MIFKKCTKRFMSLFTWGEVPSVLGINHPNSDLKEISSPTIIKAFEQYKISKIEMTNNTGVLTEDGKLLTFGPNHYGELGHGNNNTQVLPKTIKFFEKNNINITDFSFGNYHSIALDSNGKVYVWGYSMDYHFTYKYLTKNYLNSIGETEVKKTNIPKEFKGINGKVKKVFAGDTFSMALMENDDLYHWGYGRDGLIGFTMPGDYDVPDYVNSEDYFLKPQLVVELKILLKNLNTKVKKIKVFLHNIIILLENGELYCWGEDIYGQLATGRTELQMLYLEVLKPTLVKKTYEGKIKDFDISRNVLVAINDKNKVYYSGMNKKMDLTEINLPKNKTAKSIHASDDCFIIETQDNEILSSFNFIDSEKIYGKYKLKKVDNKSFENKNILKIGGYLENKFVLTQ